MSKQLAGMLDGVDQLRNRQPAALPPETPKDTSVGAICAALNAFTELVRYLNTRRSKGAVLVLESEADVQDVLYLMLRPWIHDLTPENPTDKIANKFAIKDFVSRSSRVVIEAKFVRSQDHGKSLAKEINDDIETYRYHPSCDDLIFFIYDPDGHIPDAAALARHVITGRVYDGKTLRCHSVIKP